MSRLRSLLALSHNLASHPLTRDARLAAWARFAGWIVKSRLSDREHIVPWLENQRMAVRRGMTGATGNIYLGLHEFMSMMLTLHFLREGDLFIDGGANVGSYTVLASGVCRARTWTFEPDGEARQALERNVEINDLGGLVTVVPAALGPEDGEITFTVGRGAMNQVATAGDADVQTVPQRALDGVLGDAFGDSPAAMMKLDVEGYEEQALQGAQATLEHPALKVLALEGTSAWALDLFARNGFERHYYDPFSRKLSREPNALAFSNGKWTSSNEFYVRDVGFVQERLSTARPITVIGRTI